MKETAYPILVRVRGCGRGASKHKPVVTGKRRQLYFKGVGALDEIG